MIARIWTTKFDLGRLDELRAFADDISLPMLRRQLGNRGVLYLARDDEWLTVTFWEDEAAVARLDGSADYQETVARILDMGFLRGEQETTTYQMMGGDVAALIAESRTA